MFRRALWTLVAVSVVMVSTVAGDSCCASAAESQSASCCDDLACPDEGGGAPCAPGEGMHLHPCVCLQHAALVDEPNNGAIALDSQRAPSDPGQIFPDSHFVNGVFHVPLA